MWCIINLPNGTQQAVKWDSKAIGQDCLEKVCKALGIFCEMEYFGLEHWLPNQPESRTRQWINLRNRLSCDGSSGIQLMLALRVKFWVPVHFLLQENVRNLFYMQAKADLLEGRLHARDWENAAKLAALLCQADGIRFNEQSLKAKSTIAMKKACDLLKSQLNAQKEKKEKEYVLSFKKPRLSKHKSVENIENVPADPQTATPPLSKRSASLDSSAAALSSHSANSSNLAEQNCDPLEKNSTVSLLCAYQDYIVRPASDLGTQMPDDLLQQIASEHKKLSQLKLSPKSAKYWLLREIQDLPGYGEEVFSGVTAHENSVRCDVSVGADGITVCTGDEKNKIPFSAIASAKSFRRSFKLEYVDDHNERKDLEIKLAKHAYAAGLYRSITERHAFYVCDKVRGVVTNQFVRDLKGTIASMFKEDTELGKRYVFDIQHTCREVHDQARRILHERGIEITTYSPNTDDASPHLPTLSEEASCSRTSYSNLDAALREREEREAAIERCVDTRISEAMTCKICMDRAINTLFNPCSHVMACAECAARCLNCPNCRVKVTSVVKIYLPPELRKCQPGTSGARNSLSEPTKC